MKDVRGKNPRLISSTNIFSKYQLLKQRAAFVCLIAIIFALFSPVLPVLQAEAAINPQINYQGKLTDDTGVSVTDGNYIIKFRLYTSATGATTTNIWEEIRTATGDRAAVTNGLFSVMLGSSTALTNVNFNQTLYLGVEVCGTTSLAGCDGEMTPRKILGAVPAAFEAKELDGSTDIGIGTTTPFGQLNVASGTKPQLVITDNSGGSNLKHWYASSTNGDLAWGVVNDGLSTLTERLRFTNAGNVGIGTTSPYAKLSVVGQVVGEYFTATSTTATSTFAGILSVGSTSPVSNPLFVVGTSSPALFISKYNANVGVHTNNMNFVLNGSTFGAALNVKSGTIGFSDVINLRLESYSAPNYMVSTRAGGSQSAPTVIGDGADIFTLLPLAHDGTDYEQVAALTIATDDAGGAAVGDDDMPGRMVFSTTPDGSNSVLERMRIDNKGRVGINTSATSLDYLSMLTVNGTTTDNSGFAFHARDSADASLFNIRNDGHINAAHQTQDTFDDNVLMTIGPGSGSLNINLRLDDGGSLLTPSIYGTAAGAGQTIIGSGQSMLDITATGYDGDQYVNAAQILVSGDTNLGRVPGNDDMPGKMSFLVTGDGNNGATELLTMFGTGGGNVVIGNGGTPAWDTMFSVFGTTTNSSGFAFNAFSSASVSLFNVRNDGRIGIGTTSPASTLGLVGSVFASSTGATTTFQGTGINLISAAGITPCFAVNGVCLSTGGSGTASGTAGAIQFSNGSGGFNAADTQLVWNNTNNRLGIGTSSPFAKLSVTPSAGEPILAIASSSSSTVASLFIDSANRAVFGSYNTSFTLGGTPIGSAFTISRSTPVGFGPLLQEYGLFTTERAGTLPPLWSSVRSNGHLTNQTAVAADDQLWVMGGYGHDGTDYQESAAIEFEVDGTVADNDVPGRIVFNTAAITSGVSSERMRIDNLGRVGINTTAPEAFSMLTVNGTTTDSFGFAFNARDSADASLFGIRNDGVFTKAGLTLMIPQFGGNENIYIGESAGTTTLNAFDNTAVGFEALKAVDTGSNNTAVGAQSLLVNTTGADNTAVGAFAMSDNIGGDYNTALGAGALFPNTTGDENVAIGWYTLGNLSANGSQNTAVGTQAMGNATDVGSFNSALGYQALYSNSTGQYNTAIGYQAMQSNSVGAYNVGVGYAAGQTGGNYNTSLGSLAMTGSTGMYSVAVGYGAGNNMSTGTNNIFIGYNANGTTTNTSNYLNVGNWIYGSNGNISVGTSSGLISKFSVDANFGETNTTLFKVSSSTSASASTTLFTIRNTGNVGIGTSSPYAALSVVGEAVARNFTATSTTATSTFAGVVGVGTTTPVSSPLFVVGTSSPLLFVSKISGLIGIGTNNPSMVLEVSGAYGTAQMGITSSASDAAFRISNTSTGGRNYWLGSAGNAAGAGGGNFYIYDQTAGVVRSVVDQFGSTAIGTTSARSKLTVAGTGSTNSTSTQLTLTDLGAGTNAKHWFLSSLGGNFTLGTSTDASYTSTSSYMFVKNGGKTAIATTSVSVFPHVNLTVAGGVLIASSTDAGALSVTNYSPFAVYRGDSGQLMNMGRAGNWSWSMGIGTGNQFILGVSTSSDSLFTVANSAIAIGTDGGQGSGNIIIGATAAADVGVGTTSPWRKFSVDGTVGFSGNVSAESGSDEVLCIDPTTFEVTRGGASCAASSLRFKEDIENLSYGLEEVLELRPVSYQYKESERPGDDNRYLGFIAEEMVGVIPEVVEYDDEGLPGGIDYAKLTSVLAKAIQELYASLENLTGQTIRYVNATFDNLFAKEVRTDKLCVGSTCVTEDEFMAMVQNAGAEPIDPNPSPVGGGGGSTTTSTTTDPLVEPDPEPISTSTDPVVEPDPIVPEPIVEPNPVVEPEPVVEPIVEPAPEPPPEPAP